jgi:hypothetical protein
VRNRQQQRCARDSKAKPEARSPGKNPGERQPIGCEVHRLPPPPPLLDPPPPPPEREAPPLELMLEAPRELLAFALLPL